MTACTSLPPAGDQMIGADADDLIGAYGSPVSRSETSDGPPGSQRIVFVHPGAIAPETGLQREQNLCDRLGFAAGVETFGAPCEQREDWTVTGDTIAVSCTLRFTLAPDGRVTGFIGEPAGCDALLSPR